MNKFEQIAVLYKLKEVERVIPMKDRLESTAEHVYSMIWLADYFLPFYPQLDRLLVYDYIKSHDVPEIYAKDVGVFDEEGRKGKSEREQKSFEKLKSELPDHLAENLVQLWLRYESKKDLESRFVKAIDVLDPIFMIMHDKKHFYDHNITEEKIRAKKEPYLKEFPEMLEFFNEFISYLNQNKIFPYS